MATRQVMDEATWQRYARARAERAYWEEHYGRLLLQYPDEWVAVKDGHLIAHRYDLRDLLRDVEEQGVDRDDAYVTFLNATQRFVIL